MIQGANMSSRILSKLAVAILPLLIFAGLSLSRAVSAGEKHVISQKGKAFSTTELHVKVGDTVEFKNDDDVSHNVFSVADVQSKNNKMQTPGAEASVTFASEGTVEVRCAIHPGMKVTIQVGK